MVIENVASHRKQLDVFIDNIAGIEVNHGIAGDLRIDILIVSPCILAGNVLQIAAKKQVMEYFVFGAKLEGILRNTGDSASGCDRF